MSEHILQGPFLTRAQAARRAGVPAGLLKYRPDLLTVGGKWLQEVYFAFQFDEQGVRPDLGSVVQLLKGQYTDMEIENWLVKPNQKLSSSSPLRFLNGGGEVDAVVAAAAVEGPLREATETDDPLRPGPSPAGDEASTVAAPPRPRSRRRGARQPAFHGR